MLICIVLYCIALVKRELFIKTRASKLQNESHLVCSETIAFPKVACRTGVTFFCVLQANTKASAEREPRATGLSPTRRA